MITQVIILKASSLIYCTIINYKKIFRYTDDNISSYTSSNIPETTSYSEGS